MQRVVVRQPARPFRYVVIALLLFFVAEVLAHIGVYTIPPPVEAAGTSLDEPRDPLTGAAYLTPVPAAPREDLARSD